MAAINLPVSPALILELESKAATGESLPVTRGFPSFAMTFQISAPSGVPDGGTTLMGPVFAGLVLLRRRKA